MPDDSNASVDDISDAELASVTRSIVSQPDPDADDRERFFNEVQALLESRARRNWPGEGSAGISILIRADYPRQAAASLPGAKPSADMIGTDEPLMGRIFLLDRNASQGWSADLPLTDPGEIVEWLSTLPFADSQAIIVYRTTALLIERANGALGGTTRQQRIRDREPEVTLNGLLEALDFFHSANLITPQNCPRGVWKVGHAASYHPGRKPEDSLQSELRTSLNAWFRGRLRVEREITTEIGRIDIGLLIPLDNTNLGLAYWGVVELKVVKSFRHSTRDDRLVRVTPMENAREVAEGIRQAHAFRQNRGCAYAVLEIYDMRADKGTDPREHAEVRATLPMCSPPPEIRLMPMFGSASQAREAGCFPLA
jgi:hypothetical protein